MHLVQALIPATALVAIGCASASPDERLLGGFVVTSNPAGAALLVRDCPSCADRYIGQTPYLSYDPASELKGKYLHLVLEGYAPGPVRHLRETDGVPTERIHEEMKAGPERGAARRPSFAEAPASLGIAVGD